jgi:Uma2 family endonuclease
MSTFLATPQLEAVSKLKKRWTIAEFRALADSGVVTEEFELLDGELVGIMGKNPRHALAFGRLWRFLIGVFGQDLIATEHPVEIGEYIPDALVLPNTFDHYIERHPNGSELVLVVEVADASLRFDLGAKARLYAQGGVAEYWVVDVANEKLHVHRKPSERGYGWVAGLGPDERIAPLGKPDAEFTVATLFGR